MHLQKLRRVYGSFCKSGLWCVASNRLFVETDGLVKIFSDWTKQDRIVFVLFDDSNLISHLERLLQRVEVVVNTLKVTKEKYLKDLQCGLFVGTVVSR